MERAAVSRYRQYRMLPIRMLATHSGNAVGIQVCPYDEPESGRSGYSRPGHSQYSIERTIVYEGIFYARGKRAGDSMYHRAALINSSAAESYASVKA